MKVTLSIIKPLYRDYLRYIFSEVPDINQATFKISREHDFGKAICSYIRYSNQAPEERLTGEYQVLLHLPETKSLANAKNYHCYITKEDQRKLNDLLEIFFNIDFDRYYLKGQAIGMQQKEIIESFIVSRKLTNLLSDNETLKKRHYREELKRFESKREQLRQRAYYRANKIDFEPEKYLIN